MNDGDHVESLDFEVAGDAFTLPVASVAEVLRPRRLARPPHAPPSLLGLAILRGTVMPVVSAARLLGREQGEATGQSRILVLDRGEPCGLLVDRLIGERDGGCRPFDADALLASAFGQRASSRRPDIGALAMPAVAAGEAATLSVLGFAVDDQAYALPIDDVAAVLACAGSLTPVAGSDPIVAGLIEHRGGVLPVVPLRRLLGLPCPDLLGPLIVANLAGGPVGLLVDALQGIARLPFDRLDGVPAALTRGTGETRVDRIARRGDGTLVALLSIHTLFEQATQDRLAARAQQDRPAPQAPVAVEDGRERFVVVEVGPERFGLPVASVGEVVRRPDVLAALPGMPDFVLGAMILRGRPVPLLDGGARLGATGKARQGGGSARHGEGHARHGGSKAIVLTLRGVQTALAVDAVAGMVDVAADEVASMPGFGPVPDADGRHVVGRVATHRGHCLFLIDPDALLDEAERDMLSAGDRSKATASA